MKQTRQPDQRNRTEPRGQDREQDRNRNTRQPWRDMGNDREPRRDPREFDRETRERFDEREPPRETRTRFDEREPRRDPREFDERETQKEIEPPEEQPNFSEELKQMLQVYLMHIINNKKTNKVIDGSELEFEIRFTGNVVADPSVDSIPLTKKDYENVLQVFKSSAYSEIEIGSSTSSSIPTELSYSGYGEYLLRIYPYYNGKPSKYRCEISGMADIQKYCETNDWRQCSSVKFVKKSSVYNHDRPVRDISTTTYNIKASYKMEHSYFEQPSKNGYTFSSDQELKEITSNWSKVEKTYRYMNRVSFHCGEGGYIKMDASIVKSSNQSENGRFIPVREIHQSDVFTNFEKYEIELEIDNKEVLKSMTNMISKSKYLINADENNVVYADVKDKELQQYVSIINKELTKTIRKVLVGLQKSDYPISKSEMLNALEDYIAVLHGLYIKQESLPIPRGPLMEVDHEALIDFHHNNGGLASTKNFIGPSSVALQFEHLYKDASSKGSQTPYVPLNFAVTDKADGERCLLFLSPRNLKLYLIDMNMNIRFTGLTYNPPSMTDDGIRHLKVDYSRCFIIDGEYITKDKNGNSINLFMAFDIYFKSMNDYRHNAFIMSEKTPGHLSRYHALQETVFGLNSSLGRFTLKENAKGILTSREDIIFKKNLPSHELRIAVKNFEYSYNGTPEDFFTICNRVLSVNREYNTDGLIFTPMELAVGASPVDPILPSILQKIRWNQSLKWKPPQYNTNDFLVTTVKTSTNKDRISSLILPNTNTGALSQIPQYKTLELRCGFSYKNSGFLDASTKILNPSTLNKLREELGDRKLYMPVLFHPTEYPDKYAHICNVILTPDENGVLQMITEEGDVIEDNTIVEFRYEQINGDGFRWIPLRVRGDKTLDYRRGLRSYGNDYETANGNWKTIHQPITEEIIMTGNLPPYDEVVSNKESYYNKGNSGERDVLQKFHNYIKEQLILSNVQDSQTIIDLACGKAGDMWKWDKARASFVLGIDYSIDNIENRFDGAAARYINYYRDHPNGLVCVFAAGDTSKNVRRGDAQPNEKYKMITNAILGIGVQAKEEILTRYFGKGATGFDVCSCQFALHYFFRNKETLEGFMTNVCQNTKVGGVFIGTCYDGKKVFHEFNKANTSELVIYSSQEETDKYTPDPKNPHIRSYHYHANKYDPVKDSARDKEQNTIYWKCVRKYENDYMEDDSSSLGYSIDVYQKSIGSIHTEYLVNFDYLVRVLRNYGFEPVEIKPFDNYYEEVSKTNVGDKFSHLQDINEKYITSLNNSFVFKKVRDVDASLVSLDDAPIRIKSEEKEELEEELKMKTIRIDENKLKEKEPEEIVTQPIETSLQSIAKTEYGTAVVKVPSIIPRTLKPTTMEEEYGKPQEEEPLVGVEEIKVESQQKEEPVFTEVQKAFETRTIKSTGKLKEPSTKLKTTKVKFVIPPVTEKEKDLVNVSETFDLLTTRPFNAIDEKQTMGGPTSSEVEVLKPQTKKSEIPIEFKIETETDTPIITFKTKKPKTKIVMDEEDEEFVEVKAPIEEPLKEQVVEEVQIPVEKPLKTPSSTKAKPVICKENQEIVNNKCYKKCDEDQVRNPDTGRCKKVETNPKAPKKSKIIIEEDFEESPKAVTEEKKASPESSPESPPVKLKSITKTRKNTCKEEQEVNPESGRCRKKCEEGETRSATTGKCLKTKKNK